jgi:CheY-like chemotaxis protein
VPIVALTAWAFADQVKECLNAGMDGHLAKPFTLEALRAAVAAHARPRGQRRRSECRHFATPTSRGLPS